MEDGHIGSAFVKSKRRHVSIAAVVAWAAKHDETQCLGIDAKRQSGDGATSLFHQSEGIDAGHGGVAIDRRHGCRR